MPIHDDAGPLLQQLVDAVRSARKYAAVSQQLIARIGAAELDKGRRLKDAIKATKGKLHQIAAAYQATDIDYAQWSEEVAGHAQDDQALRMFCLHAMQQHASTRERIPILTEFYEQIFLRTGEVATVLDLACGLNPLALPWMPFAPHTQYLACDIYQDQVGFLNHFLSTIGVPGHVWVCDLLSTPSLPKTDLILLLKALPCLEQIDKSAVASLLTSLDAPHIVLSFPVQSIGGRGKVLLATYRDRFSELRRLLKWEFEELLFDTELAYFGIR